MGYYSQKLIATDNALQGILLTIPPVEVTLNPQILDILASEMFLVGKTRSLFNLPKLIVIDCSTDNETD